MGSVEFLRAGARLAIVTGLAIINKTDYHGSRESRLRGDLAAMLGKHMTLPARSGMALPAFVTDVFSRRIVGMNHTSTDLPLEALEEALRVRDRAGQDVPVVIQQSDRGIASTGSVGDS